jgi:hypothetical protein
MNVFLDTLTLEEVEYYETETGEPIGEVYDKGFIAKSTIVLYYLHKKRANPDFQLADAKKVTPVEAMEELNSYSPKVVEA